jgi:hypothetical protein
MPNKVNVTISATVVDAQTGAPFASQINNYADVPMGLFNEIESRYIDFFKGLSDLAKQMTPPPAPASSTSR